MELGIEIEVVEIAESGVTYSLMGGPIVRKIIIKTTGMDGGDISLTFINENGITIDPEYLVAHIDGIDTNDLMEIVRESFSVVMNGILDELDELEVEDEECNCPICSDEAETEISDRVLALTVLVVESISDLEDFIESLSDEEFETALKEIEGIRSQISMITALASLSK